MSLAPHMVAVYNVTHRGDCTRHWARNDGFPRCGAPLGLDSQLIDVASPVDIECRRCRRLGPALVEPVADTLAVVKDFVARGRAAQDAVDRLTGRKA